MAKPLEQKQRNNQSMASSIAQNNNYDTIKIKAQTTTIDSDTLCA